MFEVNITKDNFEKEVKNSEIPVLIDFWASWCAPCRMLSPTIDEIAAEYEGRIKVGKVNVDEEPELATAFRVSSIPLVAFVKDGELVGTSVGYVPKSRITALFENKI